MIAEIYTKDNCGYCVRAKALFNKKNIEYFEISATDNRADLIDRVTKETGQAPKSVPQIWIDGEYVGGHDELVIWLDRRA